MNPISVISWSTESLLAFVERVSEVLNDRASTPLPNNTYSYETGFSSGNYPEPPVYLTPTESHSAIASTDCSGWLSFALDTVSPLHRAALQSQRHLSVYNKDYEGGLSLRESPRLWSRAYVVTNFFLADYAEAAGFQPVKSFSDLRRGDIAAYAIGRYANPSDPNLRRTGDTGHVFIVTGEPKVVDPSTPNYDGNGTLSERAEKVIAVPGIDSSSIPHFPPDSRHGEDERFRFPEKPPHATAVPGGIGSGTLWFALDADGQVLQARIGPRKNYLSVVAAAARMVDSISLVPEITDSEGDLVIEAFDNTPTHFGGVPYGRIAVQLTGPGGLRIAGDGAVILNARNDFSGGVTVESGALIVQSARSLGTGPVEIRGGTLVLERPAIDEKAAFRITDADAVGAIDLEFNGEDVVQSVQIGDEVHTCGTWGSADSPAAFKHPVFRGPGVLRVGSEETPCPGPKGHQGAQELKPAQEPEPAAASEPAQEPEPAAEPEASRGSQRSDEGAAPAPRE